VVFPPGYLNAGTCLQKLLNFPLNLELIFKTLEDIIIHTKTCRLKTLMNISMLPFEVALPVKHQNENK